MSETLQKSVRLRIAAAALRSVEHRGGLDEFLIKSAPDVLSPYARDLKRQIHKGVAIPAEIKSDPI